MTLIIPIALLIQIKLASGFDHGLKMGIWLFVNVDWSLMVRDPRVSRHHWRPRSRLWQQAILKVGVNGGVIQIDRGQDDVKQRFCTFELALQSLDILGSRIAATIRGLIICAGRVSITGVAGYLQADWGFTILRSVSMCPRWAISRQRGTYHSCRRCSGCKAACHRI